MKKIGIVFFYLCIIQFTVVGNHNQTPKKLVQELSISDTTKHKIPLSNSVLATGNWYRFYVKKTGVHKITTQFLSSLGMDITQINPSTLKIYGNGGHMLPLKNNQNQEFGLKENTVKIVGGEDGTLSKDDYILFYGEGTKQYNIDSKTHINVYDDKSYYFITADGKKGNRLEIAKPISAAIDTVITSFRAYQFHELDTHNLGLIGRRWLGAEIAPGKEKQISFQFPNIVANTTVDYIITAVAQSHKSSKLTITLNKKNLGEIKFGPISNRMIAREGRLKKSVQSDSDDIRIHLNYEVEKGVAGKSYLDYIGVSAERYLMGSDKQFQFVIPETGSAKEIAEIHYKKANKTSEIWDITNPTAITFYKNSSFSDTFNFKIKQDQSRKFAVVPVDDFYEPLKEKNAIVKNQDLKGTVFFDKTKTFSDIDYLLITTKDMLSAAERLADFHKKHSDLNVKVVPVHKIYNEFSSGKQDIGAIRNFIRYVYTNASVDNKRLRYVCLMGNATIDYKNKLVDSSSLNAYKRNNVPSFLSYNSFSNAKSFVSDDFFVMMDPKEGTMKSIDGLDIIIGRMLVKDNKTANEVVDKYIRYYQKSSFGDWRNNILLLSDDVDKYWERKIQENLDRLGDSLTVKYPFLNLAKVYSDAYLQKSTFSGDRYPGMTKELVERIERGVAVVDYFGHAVEYGFGIEFFFTKKEARGLTNKDRLPLFITVTCLATRFDNPFDVSIGEHLFKNPNGGAIGLIGTTREIFLTGGIKINNKIIASLFSENGPLLKPAEAVLKLKNELRFHDKRSVFFIGDPAMSIQMPKSGARITKINGVPVHRHKDTLSALDTVKISGEITTGNGTIRADYTGEIALTVFDKEIASITLGNNYFKKSKSASVKLRYNTQSRIIFRGNAAVQNGKFDLDFVIPKDIDMSVGNCKISMYASSDVLLEDVFGVENEILLGGVNQKVLADTKGPEIELSINDKKEKAITVVQGDPEIKIRFKDENGVNLSDGIGHQIILIVDGNQKSPILLNDFYKNEGNSYKEGVLKYTLKKIKPGYHTVEIKVWDTFNNSSVKKAVFVVLDPS